MLSAEHMAGRTAQYNIMMNAAKAFAEKYLPFGTPRAKLTVRGRLLNQLLTELRKEKP